MIKESYDGTVTLIMKRWYWHSTFPPVTLIISTWTCHDYWYWMCVCRCRWGPRCPASRTASAGGPSLEWGISSQLLTASSQTKLGQGTGIPWSSYSLFSCQAKPGLRTGIVYSSVTLFLTFLLPSQARPENRNCIFFYDTLSPLRFFQPSNACTYMLYYTLTHLPPAKPS